MKITYNTVVIFAAIIYFILWCVSFSHSMSELKDKNKEEKK
jgi:hypothetical protein